MVLLKRLPDALRDNDRIYAVIHSSYANNDGNEGSNIAAPSYEAQSEAISASIKRSGIDPADIGYYEAHGTATRIGDPIEIKGITEAFRQFTDNVITVLYLLQRVISAIQEWQQAYLDLLNLSVQYITV